jgi:hypothetical protein
MCKKANELRMKWYRESNRVVNAGPEILTGLQLSRARIAYRACISHRKMCASCRNEWSKYNV